MVNASNGLVKRCHAVQGVSYLEVDVDDLDDEPIGEHFDRVVEFVDNARENGGAVLIHCAAVSQLYSTVFFFLFCSFVF